MPTRLLSPTAGAGDRGGRRLHGHLQLPAANTTLAAASQTKMLSSLLTLVTATLILAIVTAVLGSGRELSLCPWPVGRLAPGA